MKTIVLMLFVLCTGIVFGQQDRENLIESTKCIADNRIIVINPLGKDEIRSYQFNRGESIKFCITNVNVFKVKGNKVETTGKNFSFTSDIFEQMEKKDEEIGTGNSNAFMNIYKEFLQKANKIALQANFENNIRKSIIGDDPIIKNPDLIKTEATNLYDAAYQNNEEISELIIDLRTLYSEMKSITGEVKIINNSQETVSNSKTNDDKKINKPDLKEVLFSYDDEMLLAKKIMKTFDDPQIVQEITEKASAGAVLYKQLQREDFIYYTDGVQLNDDEVTLTPVLLSADGKELRKFNSITVKTSGGGVRVNFSTGYMLSFIGDQNFALKYDALGNTVGVNELESSKLTHAIGGLAHVFWTRKDFSWGFSAGLSANTEAKISFYFGPSIAFLDKNRLVLSGGLSMVNVKRLDRNNLDGNDNFINPNIKEITYSGVYKFAGFFGVTYNLSKN
ncbi:hypothetical protein N0B40_19305 [Chryseobacterium oranimense]|uniref:hypothetical protein n=1 Tax=Chryseobacterium oranimense TaxID=421058 RepID=UPI0021AFCD3A|nr:hypothetical protein [Chryseobacterium oranimense]UWX60524.1 hypothetical protein N0B40_19305 [Chryseobacterium oranimense]